MQEKPGSGLSKSQLLSGLIPPPWFAGKDTNTPYTKSGGLGGLQEWEEAKEKKFGQPTGTVEYVLVADAPVRSHVEEDISAEFCSNTVSNESVAQLDGVIIASQVQAQSGLQPYLWTTEVYVELAAGLTGAVPDQAHGDHSSRRTCRQRVGSTSRRVGYEWKGLASRCSHNHGHKLFR